MDNNLIFLEQGGTSLFFQLYDGLDGTPKNCWIPFLNWLREFVQSEGF